MKNIVPLYEEPLKTYLMSDKVRKATAMIGVITHSNGTKSIGLAATTSTHLLFAEANSNNPAALFAALSIVHSHMYFITDEALRIAILIAEGGKRPEDDSMMKKAKSYLCHGITIEKAYELAWETTASTALLESIAHELRLHYHPENKEHEAAGTLATT